MSSQSPKALPAVLACLAEEHRHMQALLKILELRAGKKAALQKADYYLMRDIVGYLHDYPDEVHHPTEDLLFLRLGRLRPDLGAEIAAIESQHQRLDRESSRLLEILDAAIGSPASPGEQTIRKQVQSFAQHQRSHMQRESRSLFPAALADMKPADWKVLSKRVGLHEDPLFGKALQARHRSLFEFLLDADRLFPATAASSAMDAQERWIAAVTAIEQGGRQGLAVMQKAACNCIEETWSRLVGERRPATLSEWLVAPWRYGWFMAGAFKDCSIDLLGITAVTTRETIGAALRQARE